MRSDGNCDAEMLSSPWNNTCLQDIMLYARIPQFILYGIWFSSLAKDIYVDRAANVRLLKLQTEPNKPSMHMSQRADMSLFMLRYACKSWSRPQTGILA